MSDLFFYERKPNHIQNKLIKEWTRYPGDGMDPAGSLEEEMGMVVVKMVRTVVIHQGQGDLHLYDDTANNENLHEYGDV